MNEYKKKNRTGIPDAVKTQFESRSGYSFASSAKHLVQAADLSYVVKNITLLRFLSDDFLIIL